MFRNNVAIIAQNMKANTNSLRTVRIALDLAGSRIDQALARLFPEFSRNRLQHWIKAGLVKVDRQSCRSRDRVIGGELVELEVPLEDQVECRPQNIPLKIIHEDNEILVVNKPSGLVVHPAAGNPDMTLLNGLLFHDPELIHLPRAGLVHRLDKDTSGLLVVAKRIGAHRSLIEQLQAREIAREYNALVTGDLTAGGTIDLPIGRHPVHRTRMAVVNNGKPAISYYRVLERFQAHTRLKVKLETGRTHQIRVHLAHIGYPLVGDPLYGGRRHLPAGTSTLLQQAIMQFPRQALHACSLTLKHPKTGVRMAWQAPMPEDMISLLEMLRQHA